MFESRTQTTGGDNPVADISDPHQLTPMFAPDTFPLLHHLAHLPENNQVIESVLYKTIGDYREGFIANLKAKGLSGIGKSDLRYELTLFLLLFGPTLTWDYELAIKSAELQGKVKNKSGERQRHEFQAANVNNNRINDLFLETYPGPVFVVSEEPGFTGDPFGKAGDPRGDWDYDRRDAQPIEGYSPRRKVTQLVLGGDEPFRLRNFMRREQPGQGSPLTFKNLREEQERAAPLKAGIQHRMNVVDIMWYLIQHQQLPEGFHHYYEEGKTRKHLVDLLTPGYVPQRDDNGRVIVDAERVEGQPERMVEIIRDILKPRAEQFVYGNVASERMKYIHAVDISDDDVLKNHSKTRLEGKYGLHLALLSQSRGNRLLSDELDRLYLPDLLGAGSGGEI